MFCDRGGCISWVSPLEARQRYCSYRATLVAIAIVLQKYFVFVLMGYRIIMARYVAKSVMRRCVRVKLCMKGGIAPFGGSANLPEKVSRNKYRNVARPLDCLDYTPKSKQLESISLELILGKGMRTATFQFSESGGSVNGPNLFIELPFL